MAPRSMTSAFAGLAISLSLAATALAQTPTTWTAPALQQDMLSKIGVSKLKPGRSGDDKGPNPANYDESKANVFTNYPDLLTARSGKKVTTPADWKARRAEIAADFEREVYGRVPASAPGISWKVEETKQTTMGSTPVIARRVVGAADNSAAPAISVNIRMVVVTPANAKKPVPLLIMFDNDVMPTDGEPQRDQRGDLPRADQAIAAGWGYALLSWRSIQDDRMEGLTSGVIGLSTKGAPRQPEDWGMLRAWGWGASRALDYLLTDPTVDGKRIGIEGVSRYGKAALVAMAFDERFAVGLIASSGKGGIAPFRRDFGETVNNLAGLGAAHWMAGNFLKYASADAGGKTWGDLPVDSDGLIALAAPRPVFISAGVPEKGDANWLDHFGSFQAVMRASPVWALLGAKGLTPWPGAVTDAPPANTAFTDGALAWRRHDGGHTDRPNLPHFFAWADKQLGVAR